MGAVYGNKQKEDKKEDGRKICGIGLDILSYLKNIPLLHCNAIGRESVADHWKCFTDFLKEIKYQIISEFKRYLEAGTYAD